jgi:hypothetical protein
MRIERREGFTVVVGAPVPPGSSAITLGSVVFVRPGRERSEYLMRHEAVHVRQWRRLGVGAFVVRYAGAYVGWRLRRKGHWGAYRRIPLEVEADWEARRSLTGVTTSDTATR